MADERVRIRIRRGDWEFEVEGPQEFVEAQMAEAETKYESSLRVPPPRTVDRPVGEAAPSVSPRTRLKDFVDAKSPKGHFELIPTLAYWARENESLADVDKKELERLYKVAELRRPTDAKNMMAQIASQKGWLESAGVGRYRLTAPGEDFVTLDLPRKK